MTATVESLPHCIATLSVELPPEKVKAKRDALAADFIRHAKVPGFRPGKIPRNVVESRFKNEIAEELRRGLISDAIEAAIKEKSLRILQVQNVEDIELAPDDRMSFKATLITVPEFDLPEYKGVAVRVPTTAITDAEVDAELERLRASFADYTDITGRPAAMNDILLVDYEGTVDGRPVMEAYPKAGKPLTANADFGIRMRPGAFLPGFCEALEGAAIGETRAFDVVVPNDFDLEDIRGVRITYKVTVKSIKEQILPDLDDTFANIVEQGQTLEGLRATVRQELEAERKHAIEIATRDQVMAHLVSSVECELPQQLVRNQTERILDEIVRENQQRGVADEVLKEHEKDLVGAAAGQARNRIKATFILLRIAEKEGITVTERDLTARLISLAARLNMSLEKTIKELKRRDAIRQIREDILTSKTLDFLATNATVETVEQPVA